MLNDKVKVLYIDDEVNNLNSFKAAFRFEYQVYVALNGTEAKEQLKHEPDIKVILCDQRMPEQTGAEFYANIREQYPLPVKVLITGYSDLEAVIDAINKGNIFKYIRKPWVESEIRAAIEDGVVQYHRNVFGTGSLLERSGYTVLDIMEHERGLLVDVLRGFEDYAKLKGYGVTGSYDTSVRGTVAVKFTLLDVAGEGRNVKQDIQEYLDKLGHQKVLDDIPERAPNEEHEQTFAILKSRLQFLYGNPGLHEALGSYKQLMNHLPEAHVQSHSMSV